MVNFTKPWWESKGVIGGAVAFVASVTALFGMEIDQAALTDILPQLCGAIGGVVAVIGRFKAQKPLRWGK